MAQYCCPSCGSKFFITKKNGEKGVFEVVEKDELACLQGFIDEADLLAGGSFSCGACSWQGGLVELVECLLD